MTTMHYIVAIRQDDSASKDTLEWTTDPPIEPGGFYWASRKGYEPVILFVFFDGGQPFCMIVGTKEGNPNFKQSRALIADVTHWIGPLPVPSSP